MIECWVFSKMTFDKAWFSEEIQWIGLSMLSENHLSGKNIFLQNSFLGGFHPESGWNIFSNRKRLNHFYVRFEICRGKKVRFGRSIPTFSIGDGSLIKWPEFSRIWLWDSKGSTLLSVSFPHSAFPTRWRTGNRVLRTLDFRLLLLRKARGWRQNSVWDACQIFCRGWQQEGSSF